MRAEDGADHGRLLVIEHELDAPAGLLGPWARARGLSLDTVHLGGGDRLPGRLPDVAGVVVLGSEQTAFDDAVPWLPDELSLVGQALADGVPLLGICFGGQVLARALGARVYRLPEPEIGWVRVASQHPGLASGPWLEWHRDGFGLPPGARELATGGASVQAYAIGPHLGLQFHPEATETITQAWLRATDPPLSPAQAGRLRQGWQDADDRTAADAAVLFSSWLDGEFAVTMRPAASTGPAHAGSYPDGPAGLSARKAGASLRARISNESGRKMSRIRPPAR